MRRGLRFALAVAAPLFDPSAAMAAPAAELPSGGAGVVAEVVDGDTVILASAVAGAREVRLVGIQAPKLPLGRPNFPTWPLAPEAKNALEGLLLGLPVTLHFGGEQRDRHGRLLAHLVTEAGLWAQGEMVRLGLARVYSFPDNRASVAELYALEREARAQGRGIWRHPFYAIRAPEALERHLGTFQLVEGRVVDAARARGTVFLNFGADWRTDFTVAIERDALGLFRQAKLDPLALKGKRVRVRGWLQSRNGPLIEASHPEQIELLGD